MITASLVQNHFDALHPTWSNTPPLTVGVEHEFFLVDVHGNLADQDVFETFWRRCAEHPLISSREAGDGTVQMRVSTRCGSTHWLKLEHGPHMLELATGHTTEPRKLAEWLDELWETLEEVTKESNTKVRHVGHWARDIEAGEAILDPHRMSLLESRARLARAVGLGGDPNFTARLASTQINIGGLQWWRTPRLIHTLLVTELDVLDAMHDRAELAQRDLAYARVFAPMNLLLFPKHVCSELPFVETWARALDEQPTHQQPSSGLAHSATSTAEEIFYQRRDLSYIRPRPTGALEFRGSPACSRASDIMHLVRARLDQCMDAVHARSMVSVEQIKRAREEWCERFPDDVRSVLSSGGTGS